MFYFIFFHEEKELSLLNASWRRNKSRLFVRVKIELLAWTSVCVPWNRKISYVSIHHHKHTISKNNWFDPWFCLWYWHFAQGALIQQCIPPQKRLIIQQYRIDWQGVRAPAFLIEPEHADAIWLGLFRVMIIMSIVIGGYVFPYQTVLQFQYRLGTITATADRIWHCKFLGKIVEIG